MRIQGKYELETFLGEGAMGCVYRAVHTMLNRNVAVKLMKAVEVNESETKDRFEREARAASRLNHPHVVSMVDFGRTEGGLLYLITEYVNGTTLMEILRQTPVLPLDRVFTIFNQVLAAVEEAHSARVIHRDLKPENIIVTRLRSGEDFAKVLDFGVASMIDEKSSRITQDGMCLGTPGYIAPEHIVGEAATERSDIYSLGAILYELLTGRPAYEEGAATKVLTTQLYMDPKPMTEISFRPNLGATLPPVVMKAMARDPQERYGTIMAFADALTDALAGANLTFQSSRFSIAMPAGPISSTPAISPGQTPIRKTAGYDVIKRPKSASSVSYGRTEPNLLSTQKTEPRISIPTPEIRASAPWPHPTDKEKIDALEAVAVGPELVGWKKEGKAVVSFLTGDQVLLDIVGPEGAGKSVIAEGIARTARELGLVLYRSGSDPWLSKSPWYPVRKIIGDILGCGPAPAEKKHLLDAFEKSQLNAERDFKGLSQLFGFGPYETLSPDERMSSAMHRSTIKALGLGVANMTGICLLLEDAQEYDRASLSFFRNVEKNSAPGSLRVAVTSEAGLFPSREENKLRLSPLDDQSVDMLIKRHMRNTARKRPSLGREILAASQGNPLHTIQSIRCVDEGGAVHKSLADTVEERLGKLTPDARAIFEAICALGRSVSTNLLNDLLHDDSLFLALEWLLLAGWISVDDARSVAPMHRTIAHIVRELMPQQKLLGLHKDILKVLKKRNVPVFVLAHHALEAKSAQEAVKLLEKAGDEAYVWFDEEQAALEYYKRAVHVARWELLMGEDNPDYLSLQLKLGNALKQSGHYMTAKVVLKEVINYSNRFPDIRSRAERILNQVGGEI